MTQPVKSSARLGSRRFVLPLGVGIAALAFGAVFASPDAHASVAGQAALNAKLAAFATQTNLATPKTTLTATVDDLSDAVSAILFDPTNTLTPQDVASSALEAVGGKVRASLQKDAAKIFQAATLPVDPTHTTVISNILVAITAVNTDGNNLTSLKTELSTVTKAAVFAEALKLATVAGAGNTFVQNAKPAITQGLTETAVKTFATNVILGVGTSNAQVQSFVDGLYDAGAVASLNRQTFAKALAQAVVAKNKVGAGLVIGAGVQDITDDTQIQGIVVPLLADAKLKTAISDIVAATSAELNTTTPQAFAVNLSANQKALAKAQIASGAIRSSPGNAAVIVNAVLGVTTGEVVTASNLVTFGGGAVTGLTASADVAAVAQTLAAKPGVDKNKLGAAMVKTVAATTNPAVAGSVATGILATTVPDKTAFAVALALGAPTNSNAVGGVSGAVAATLTTQQALADLSAAVIKKASKSATGVAQFVGAVSLTLGGSQPDTAKLTQYVAALLPQASTAASSIAVGTSITAPSFAEKLTSQVVLFNTKTQAAAATIGGAVALAVDVEKTADIATELGKKFTVAGGTANLKTSQASAIATSLAKAINTKPLQLTTNRADELGELAASLTAQLLNPAATTDATRVSTVTAVGKAIIAVLSKTGIENTGFRAVDQREAADIAGSIAQTISISALTAAQKDALLAKTTTGAPGALEKALVAAVGAAYKQAVTNAFEAVRTAGYGNIVAGTEKISNGTVTNNNGKYEIGSVIDPETRVKNL